MSELTAAESGSIARVASAFASFAVKRPKAVLAAFALLTLALAPGLLRLRVDTDGNALVPEGAPEVLVDRAVRARFDLRDVVAVVVEARGANGVFEAAVLELVEALTRELEHIDGLAPGEVTSLATERSDRVVPGKLEFRGWLDPLPRTQAELAALRASLDQVGIFAGTLLSTDAQRSATAILVRVPPGADRPVLVRAIEAAILRCQSAMGDASARDSLDVHVVGAPVVESLLGLHTLAELARLLPLALIALSLVFVAAFRCAPALAIPMLEVGSALIVVFGAMGLADSPIYLTTAVVPVILTAVGVTDEVHLMHAFRARLRRDPGADPRRLSAETMGELSGAIVATSLTTAIGFGAFAWSPLAPVRTFGIFMAIGVLYCMVWSLVCVPALLASIPRSWWRAGGERGERQPGAKLGGALAQIGAWSYARRRALWVCFAVLCVVLPFLAARAKVQDSWVESFSPHSSIRRSTERVEALFGGTHFLQVAITAECVRASGSIGRAALEPGVITLPAMEPERVAMLAGHRISVQPSVEGRASSIGMTAHIASAELDGTLVRLRLDPRDPDIARRWPSAALTSSWQIDGADRALEPAMLEHVRAFEGFLAAQGELGVGRVLGTWEQLATANFMVRGRNEAARDVPSDPRAMPDLLDNYRRVRGAQQLARTIEGEGRAVLTTALLRHANFDTTRRLLERVREYEREHLAPAGLTLELAGDIAVSQALVGGIVESQVSSLGLSLAGIVLSLAVILRSLRLGLLCTIPAAFVVLASFAFMATFDVPVGVATSMFAGMLLGVGVDYAVHLCTRMRALASEGVATADRAAQALRAVGPAIVVDVCAVGAAFGLLAVSSVPANARLGALVLVGLAAAFATTLLLLPTAAPNAERE